MNRPRTEDTGCYSEPFWDGVEQGRFMLQYDPAACRFHFYPKPLYDREGQPLPWVRATGEGRLVAYTLSRVPGPGFEGQVPYALGLVRLHEGPRVFAPLTGFAFDRLRTGLRVEVRFGVDTLSPAPYSFEVTD